MKSSQTINGKNGAKTSNDDIQLTLDFLIFHKKNFTQEFLRERELPFSGTKTFLRERLNGYLCDGKLENGELLELLNEIEGWGNQHVYLYVAQVQEIEAWSDFEKTKSRLRSLGLLDLLNHQRPLVLPMEPTLVSIDWSAERVQFLWVENRQWEERVEEEDIQRENMIWKAYRIKSKRSLTRFELDLTFGHAMLMIPKSKLLPGKRYKDLKESFEQELEPIIGISRFQSVNISRAIRKIEASGEVLRQELEYATKVGNKAKFTSTRREIDAYEDPDLEKANIALGDEKSGLLGDIYWRKNLFPDVLDTDLHTRVYGGFDQSVNIYGQRRETEVRHVLQRIRKFSE